AMRHLGLEVWCLRKAGLARIALEFRKCSDLNVERKIQALGDDPGGQGDHGVGDSEDLFRPAGTKHSLQLGDSDLKTLGTTRVPQANDIRSVFLQCCDYAL